MGSKIKRWIATKIFKLKVIDVKDELLYTQVSVLFEINNWYSKYKDLSPSRNSANINDKRIQILVNNVNKIFKQTKLKYKNG